MDQADAGSDHSMASMGISASNPHSYFKDNEHTSVVFSHLSKNDLRSAIITGFNLSESDSYVYHAIASVTLQQVQAAVEAGTAHGLCNWYLGEDGTPVQLLVTGYNA